MTDKSENATPPPVTSGQIFKEKLAALKRAAALCPAPIRKVTPPRIAGKPHTGQVWDTRKVSGDSAADEDYDPCWVVLLKQCDDYGRTIFEAAPIFTEVEMAADDDVVLPRDLLGFECAVAVGTSISVLKESLAYCEGELPAEWVDRLLAFHGYINGPSETTSDSKASGTTPDGETLQLPAGIQTGLPFLSETDPAYKFHEKFIERLDYLQQPVLEWAYEQPARAADTGKKLILGTIVAEIGRYFEEIWLAEDDEPYEGECVPVALHAEEDVEGHEGEGGKRQSFSLGSVCIDGVERRMLTDGDNVAVLLRSNEHPSGLWIDDRRVQIVISPSGKLAVLVDFMRADANLLLSETATAPTKHVLRWESETEGSNQ